MHDCVIIIITYICPSTVTIRNSEEKNSNIIKYSILYHNLLVNIAARNSGNCNLIGHVVCYDYMVIYMYLYRL